MQLCFYSKSTVYRREILPSCPLALNAKEARHCPARKRLYLPNDLRVLGCCHPSDWRGSLIRDNLQVKHAIQRKLGTYKESEPPKPTAPIQETTMTESNNEPTKNLPAVVTRQTLTKSFSVAPLKDQHLYLAAMAKMFYDSKMFGCNNIGQAYVLACACGGDPTRAIKLKQTYHIIGGNLTMRSDAMLAKFVSNPKNSYKLVSRTPEKAAIELKAGTSKQLFEITWAEAAIEDYVWTKPANEDKCETLRQRSDQRVDAQGQLEYAASPDADALESCDFRRRAGNGRNRQLRYVHSRRDGRRCTGDHRERHPRRRI
jgi:hypothetical protein